MQNKEKTAVVLGRFQGPTMHPGYVELLKYTLTSYDRTIIVLGVASRKATDVDPLPVVVRRRLILDYCVEVLHMEPHELPTFFIIKDMRDDVPWVKKLDTLIEIAGLDKNTFNFVSGRDSFKSYYVPLGEYPDNFDEVPTVEGASSTKVREELSEINFDDYSGENMICLAEGIVWATQQPYPRTDITVDIAILKGTEIVLGRKKNESKWRLPGGFFDINLDSTVRDAAIREAFEETKISISRKDCNYIDSMVVSDWRYRKGKDRVVTNLFMVQFTDDAELKFLDMVASDDLEEIKLVALSELIAESFATVVEGHIPLIHKVVANLT